MNDLNSLKDGMNCPSIVNLQSDKYTKSNTAENELHSAMWFKKKKRACKGKKMQMKLKSHIIFGLSRPQCLIETCYESEILQML